MPIRTKLHNQRGMSWLIAILLLAIIVLSITSMIPFYRKYQEQGNTLACATALDTARRFVNGSAEKAKSFVAQVMNGWNDLCPEYGTVYIIRRTDGSPLDWDIVCGLHGTDRKLCTRLNAEYALDQLKDALRVAQANGVQYPLSLEFTLHGKTHTAYLVDETTNLHRGTGTTKGYDGLVAFYSVVGHSDFGSGKGKNGSLWYFSYADVEHCANWRSDNGWTGDSYQ